MGDDPESPKPEPPLRLAMLGNGTKHEVPGLAARLGDAVISTPGLELTGIDLSGDSDLSTLDADIAVVIGGDGTVLHTARRMDDHPTPVLGINAGRLGFLADLTPDAFVGRLDDLAARRFHVDELMTLRCTVTSVDGSSRVFRGLNDVVVRAAPVFHLLDLGLDIDGEGVMTYRCDGLIVATPMGSTAHSLSAGGPILPPGEEMFVVTPICAHTLTQRPLVDSADKVYELALRSDAGAAVLVIDGQVQVAIEAGDRVAVRRGSPCFPMVRLRGHSFYTTLRGKLGWGTVPPGERCVEPGA